MHFGLLLVITFQDSYSIWTLSIKLMANIYIHIDNAEMKLLSEAFSQNGDTPKPVSSWFFVESQDFNGLMWIEMSDYAVYIWKK